MSYSNDVLSLLARGITESAFAAWCLIKVQGKTLNLNSEKRVK